jgi:hypothetical protein
VLGGREASDAIETPTHPLEAPLPDVMAQKLATDAMLARLVDGEIAALLVGLGFEAADVRLPVMHK